MCGGDTARSGAAHALHQPRVFTSTQTASQTMCSSCERARRRCFARNSGDVHETSLTRSSRSRRVATPSPLAATSCRRRRFGSARSPTLQPTPTARPTSAASRSPPAPGRCATPRLPTVPSRKETRIRIDVQARADCGGAAGVCDAPVARPGPRVRRTELSATVAIWEGNSG